MLKHVVTENSVEAASERRQYFVGWPNVHFVVDRLSPLRGLWVDLDSNELTGLARAQQRSGSTGGASNVEDTP